MPLAKVLGDLPSRQALIALIEAVAAKDREALGALYDATSSRVYPLVLDVMGDPASAEEVLLATFTAVWQQAPTYQNRPHPPLLWILKIARDLALARCQSRRPRFVVAHTGKAVSNERPTAIQAAINDLPPEQRTTLELACYSGSSCTELAKILNLPPEMVKRHIYLGMLHLREILPLQQAGMDGVAQPTAWERVPLHMVTSEAKDSRATSARNKVRPS